MRSWPAVPVPALPGSGDEVRVHDTASGALRAAAADAADATARLYVCGVTPYDATHIGHAATYVAFDLLVRAWLDAGQRVRYVQNVTDVDDPLLERARETGEEWSALAQRETELYREDMAALRVLPPDEYVAVTEAVDLISAAVERLRERGAAYELDRDVYFAVASDPGFGSVSGLDAGTMRQLSEERGGDPDRPGKKDPLDPLLWLAAREGEPSWPSPLGPGRPGWHVECSAIALEHLGKSFDVQGGGSDLVFPHHEMSAAHAEVLTGSPFAHSYVHVGMVALHGEKMSKSRGNLVFVSDLLRAGRPAAAVRLALLAHHYRSDWDWTDAGLAQAEQRLSRWRAAVARPSGPDARPLLGALRARLADDLDAPGALGAFDDWVGAGGDDSAAPALAAAAADALLGIDLS